MPTSNEPLGIDPEYMQKLLVSNHKIIENLRVEIAALKEENEKLKFDIKLLKDYWCSEHDVQKIFRYNEGKSFWECPEPIHTMGGCRNG